MLQAERQEELGASEVDESLSESSELEVEDLARVNRALMRDHDLSSDSDSDADPNRHP